MSFSSRMNVSWHRAGSRIDHDQTGFAASLKGFSVCILIGHQMGLGYMGLELCVY